MMDRKFTFKHSSPFLNKHLYFNDDLVFSPKSPSPSELSVDSLFGGSDCEEEDTGEEDTETDEDSREDTEDSREDTEDSREDSSSDESIESLSLNETPSIIIEDWYIVEESN